MRYSWPSRQQARKTRSIILDTGHRQQIAKMTYHDHRLWPPTQTTCITLPYLGLFALAQAIHEALLRSTLFRLRHKEAYTDKTILPTNYDTTWGFRNNSKTHCYYQDAEDMTALKIELSYFVLYGHGLILCKYTVYLLHSSPNRHFLCFFLTYSLIPADSLLVCGYRTCDVDSYFKFMPLITCSTFSHSPWRHIISLRILQKDNTSERHCTLFLT